VLVIVAAPLGSMLAQPHGMRPTRLALAITVGLRAFGFGAVSQR
jgi:hypothetical protein